jgi:phage repressor protein C with HTH and peptisase S24 domain
MKTLGDRVKYAMQLRGNVSQGKLAKALGISQPAVYSLLNSPAKENKHAPKIAQVLNVDLDWLRTGRGAQPIEGESVGEPDELQFTALSVARIGEIDVEASAGPGQIVEYRGEAHHWSFPEYWLRTMLDAAPADIKLITIKGDSGQSDPAKATDIDPGDKVFVNVSDRRPSPPGLFVLWDGLAFVAKRVQMVPGSNPIRVRLSSNNPAYEPYEVSIEDAQIQGRIVARFQRIG